jgi:hypothetical protein
MFRVVFTSVLMFIMFAAGADITMQDDSYRTIGHIDSDGTVKDDSYRTIGHIDSDGTVKDDSYRTIAHFDSSLGTDRLRVGGYLFFFMRRF